MCRSKIAHSEGLERLEAFDRVADSFLDRVRRGERPSISDYTARYPELADQIRELLPLLVEMELAKSAGVAAETGSYKPDSADAGEIPRQLGNFRILGRLGDGGMGVVYEAIQEGLGRHVALKVIRPGFWPTPASFSGSGARHRLPPSCTIRTSCRSSTQGPTRASRTSPCSSSRGRAWTESCAR